MNIALVRGVIAAAILLDVAGPAIAGMVERHRHRRGAGNAAAPAKFGQAGVR